MPETHFYPIGTPGRPWGETECDQWRARQRRHRSYQDDVVARIHALPEAFEKLAYAHLDHAGEGYTLFAVRNANFDPSRPTALVTGGVHGYETSGVIGALEFLETRAADYASRVNLIVAPCVTPWAYERVSRWNYDALDPNRNFRADGPAGESVALIGLVRSMSCAFLLHIDLHETTDSDANEFSPARAARDGESHQPETIPDGFYLVADCENPQLAFQQAIISAVARVTSIASPDEQGSIIGSPVVVPGVIQYPLAELALCTSITLARYTTTTEVYPDSHRTTPEECVQAQVTAICAALDHALSAVRQSAEEGRSSE